MIQSMTGFGRGSASTPAKKITVEIKSLNSKQFDISTRIPSILRECEIEARNLVAGDLERGKVDLSVSVENIGRETPVSINADILASYKSQLEEVSRRLGLPVPQDWYQTLMRLPDVLVSETPETGDEEKNAFMSALAEAVKNLQEFRCREGEKLYRFFEERIAVISDLLGQVDPFESERVPKIRARLEEQLSRLESIEYDKGRLEQELIFYIEKLDVTEEKTRLRAHLNYFLETMDSPASAKEGKGKKLGFIAQEMGREINTLGSKSNHAGMQKIVVMMKDNLEQIKEQVLNVL